MSAKTTESKASRQDHPSEPAPDIDNNLYDDSESQKKDYSNADFVPLIIVVFLIMISNSPCKNIHFYRMLQVLRRLFALFSANLRRITMKRIGKSIMQELLMHSAKHPKYNTIISHHQQFSEDYLEFS
jgi:hypothetical protein